MLATLCLSFVAQLPPEERAELHDLLELADPAQQVEIEALLSDPHAPAGAIHDLELRFTPRSPRRGLIVQLTGAIDFDHGAGLGPAARQRWYGHRSIFLSVRLDLDHFLPLGLEVAPTVPLAERTRRTRCSRLARAVPRSLLARRAQLERAAALDCTGGAG